MKKEDIKEAHKMVIEYFKLLRAGNFKKADSFIAESDKEEIVQKAEKMGIKETSPSKIHMQEIAMMAAISSGVEVAIMETFKPMLKAISDFTGQKPNKVKVGTTAAEMVPIITQKIEPKAEEVGDGKLSLEYHLENKGKKQKSAMNFAMLVKKEKKKWKITI